MTFTRATPHLEPLLVCLLFMILSSGEVQDVHTQDELYPASFYRPGDLLLGGLFDIHFLLAGGEAGAVNPLSLQWMYAMVYEVERLNNRTDILPNVTLGFAIRDTRGDSSIAVYNSLAFISTATECDSSQVTPSSSPFAAVIGPRTNTAAVDTANLFDLFELPQVSYAASSTILSQSQYGYFLRTVPTLDDQIRALIDVIVHYNWTTVVLLYSEDFALGFSAKETFLAEAAEKGICVAVSRGFRIDSSAEEILHIGSEIRKYGNIRVIVGIAEESAMLELLSQFQRIGIIGYVWLGTDTWALSTRLGGTEIFPVVRNMLGIASHSVPSADFYDFLRRINPSSSEDPFIAEYWMSTTNCSLGSTSPCDDTLPSNDAFYVAIPVDSVFNAVGATARGLHDALNCSSEHGCNKEYTSSDNPKLLSAILNISFTSQSGSMVSFQSNGDLRTPAWYDIRKLSAVEDNSSSGNWETVLEWNDGDLLELIPALWADTNSLSFCSVPCTPGQYRTKIALNECCWNCTQCADDAYSQTANAASCAQCPPDQTVNSDGSGCVDIPHLYIDVTMATGISIIAFGATGLLCSSIVYFVLVIKRVKPMYSNYGSILFVAICACFGTSFLCLIKPTDLSCAIIATLQPLSVTIVTSFMIVAGHSQYHDGKTSKKTTALWITTIVGVHVVVVVLWMITAPPESRVSVSSADQAFVDCVNPGVLPGELLLICYHIILDAVGAILSHSLRRDKRYFYEGKFLFYTFVVHGMFWSAVSVTFLIVPVGYHVRTHLLSESVSVAGFIYTGGLFVPKLYALKYKPHMLRHCTVERAKQVWKFKRKSGSKHSARLRVYLRGCQQTIRVLKEETDFINNHNDYLKNMQFSDIIRQDYSLFSNLRDLYIDVMMTSPTVSRTSL